MRISIIVPCRNEAPHIDAFLESAFAQQLPQPGDELEIVVADGMSDDGTRDRLDAWRMRQPLLVVVDNPRRITSAALNIAIRQASGEIVVRMDVHTVYAPDYVAGCVEALRRTGAMCVGGAWKPVGSGWPQAAIAAAFESRFGSGGAASRQAGYDGPVDTVYLGAWRRDDLLSLGGFDESLVRNQDDELNLRINRAGGVVWQSSAIRSSYAPRASFGALFRQFYQYGYWKVAVIRKHRLPASPRHIVPFAFVLTLLVLALAGLAWTPAWIALAVLCAVYVAAAMAGAAAFPEALRTPRGVLGYLFACMCMHAGYGIGFAQGILDLVLLRRGPHDAMSRLTR
ncbi:MAG: glycosyltransferase family 2 protein [Piscinibacter sp.]|uniref:glycosyltransferase family 2 protein n=1 Tax=Piscinibacter sp. TaxID=1903157 RepID=UPI003D0BF98E